MSLVDRVDRSADTSAVELLLKRIAQKLIHKLLNFRS
jgi:hypothetical protein